MLSFEKTLLFKQIDNFQLQRHDFLNYFQVIKGYIQLNMPEKALEYLDQTIAELVPQQLIYKINQKIMIAILLGLFFDLRLKGIEMAIEIPQEMREEEYWQTGWKEEYAERFYGYTKECLALIPEEIDPGALLVEIRLLTAPQGFGCEFRLLKEGKILDKKSFYTIN
ncbi:MAG: histidine kinase [Peptococcaceae bacterium]|nr:histidine kinase [Peptococcaceae bacterium]